MRQIEDLNITGFKLPPNEVDISKVESLIGKKLPPDYLDFIRRVNGGHPEHDTFYSDDYSDAYGEWSVDKFFFIGDETESTDSVEWNFIHRWKGISSECLPIARDGGDNLFVLNFENPKNVEVWVWLHDAAMDNFFKLSDSFEEFIDRLTTNADYI